MTTSQQFPQLLAPGLNAVIFDELMELTEEYSQFSKVKTTNRAYETDQEFAGLGHVKRKLPGQPIEYDDPIQGGSVRYEPEPFALGWRATKEIIDDDQNGLIRQIPAQLGKSVHDKVERIGIQPLNLGFTTMTGFDGVSFFNSAHPLLGGGTYGNRPSTDVDLSKSAIQDAIISFENNVNHRGLRRALHPDCLWIPSELQFLAQVIMQSTMDPDSGNNAINPIHGRFQIKALHYLTSTRTWFISSKNSNHIQFWWRTKPETESQDDFETKGTKHSIYFRCTSGVSDWRGWYGSRI